MSWAHKDCGDCCGNGYTPGMARDGVTPLCNPCPRCFNSGKVMRETPKDCFLLDVGEALLEEGFEVEDVNFRAIENLWMAGADLDTAVRHFLLEAARPPRDNQGATDGSSPNPTSEPN